MNLPHDKFCVLPWISLEASPIGTARPCCLADDEIMDYKGRKYDLKQDDLDEIRQSDHMKRLRQDFLSGKQPQTCRKCWNEERSGRTSKRMHTLDRLKHVLANEQWDESVKPLMFLDLKLGNICNLKCRICGSWSSSQYATEELNDASPAERKDHFAYQMLKAGAWPRTSAGFWKQLEQKIDQVRYIEFTGGEPFLIQEHFDLLARIVSMKQASNIEIHYNTNGTTFPQDAIDLWKHFKTVEIAFSIDDTGDRFEYQRSNASWSEVSANIGKFHEVKKSHDNMRLQLCCTINIFNLLYLPETAHWIDQHDFDFVYWNILHDPWYFSIACLPESAKRAISQRLRQHDFGRHNAGIQQVCDFMEVGASTDGFMTRMKIDDLDRKRHQNLSIVAPELAELIDYCRQEKND